MRKTLMLAALLLVSMSSTNSWAWDGRTTLDDRVREADRALQQYDEMNAQRKYYEDQLSRQRSQYEEELAHQRAVTYLDPYGIDDRR